MEGSLQLFNELEKKYPNLSVILFGKPNNNDEKRICREYQQIGKCHRVHGKTLPEFRKVFYPNLIFFFGPNEQQNNAASNTFAHVIGYSHTILPASANDLILYLDKTQNFVINGLFTDPAQIKILEQFFEIKIVHFKYNRIDLPDKDKYFDHEFEVMAFLWDKPYYVQVNGKEDPVDIMDNVGIGICPRLLYAYCPSQEDREYVDAYVEETDGLILSIT